MKELTTTSIVFFFNEPLTAVIASTKANYTVTLSGAGITISRRSALFATTIPR